MENDIRKFRGVTGRARDPVFLGDTQLQKWLAQDVQEKEYETLVEAYVGQTKAAVRENMEGDSPTDWGPTAPEAAEAALEGLLRLDGMATRAENDAMVKEMTAFFVEELHYPLSDK
jgi:hypothetical protein